MVLAVPDKLVCFDFFRPLSTTGDAIVAHREQRARHAPKTLWDHFAYQVMKHGGPGWGRTDQARTAFTCTLEQAFECTKKYVSDVYIDAHSWTFVPASLALMMLELARLGLTDWRIERVQIAEYTEFYVWLRRGALAITPAMSEADFSAERMRLLNETALELDDQGRQFASSRCCRLESDLARAQEEIRRLTRAQ